jgi:hypothetical protein
VAAMYWGKLPLAVFFLKILWICRCKSNHMNNEEYWQNIKDETYVKNQLKQCKRQNKSVTQKLENFKGVLSAHYLHIG